LWSHWAHATSVPSDSIWETLFSLGPPHLSSLPWNYIFDQPEFVLQYHSWGQLCHSKTCSVIPPSVIMPACTWILHLGSHHGWYVSFYSRKV
jgi:hypothetical protein